MHPMKRNLCLSLCSALAFAAAFSAFAAEEKRTEVTLKYRSADTAFESAKEALGIRASHAVFSIDLHKNTILLDSSHPDARRIQTFLIANDLRPLTVEVSATISETGKAEGEPMETLVLGKPKITGSYGEPMTISLGDEHRTITIELVLKQIPAQEPDGK